MEIPITLQDVTFGVLAMVVLYTSLKSQNKETVGNQSIMTALIQLLGQTSGSTEGINKTLHELKELKKTEHVLIVETHQGVKAMPTEMMTRHELLKTDLTAAISRVESPLTSVMQGLVTANEMLNWYKAPFEEIHRWVTSERDAMIKQLTIERSRKVGEPTEVKHVEQPQAGESAGNAVEPNEGKHETV